MLRTFCQEITHLMPSGKQILLEVLLEASQRKTSDSDIATATERIRAALLLHGSTGGDAWDDADNLTWASERNSDGEVLRQGLALKESDLFLSDLFETIIESDEVPEHVTMAHPDLTPKQYHRATRFIWLLLSSVQWFEELSSVEGEGLDKADAERLIQNYIEKLNHFRDHPEDFK